MWIGFQPSPQLRNLTLRDLVDEIKGNDALTFGGNLITKYGATLQNEWKPIKAGKLVLAQTKMLGPNEQDTIKITFKKSGVYHYLCSFPGHFGQMRGVINVK